jgi:hypothetical protein
MPTYNDHNPDDFSFCWVPSTSRSERLERAEKLAQSIAEGSPLDSETDSLLCNLATLQSCNPVHMVR